MSDSNRYGRIISNRTVERAMKGCLEVWIDPYLGEIERIEGYEPGQIKRPLGIVTSSEFGKWPEDQLPMLLIVSPGLTGAPVRRSEGKWDATWSVGVSPIVSDVDDEGTRDLAGAYTTAVRAAIMQHQSLKSPVEPDGFGAGTVWIGETYADIPIGQTRTLGSGVAMFGVQVQTAVIEQAGPRNFETEGTPEDPGPWPDVQSVEVRTRPVPITEAP